MPVDARIRVTDVLQIPFSEHCRRTFDVAPSETLLL